MPKPYGFEELCQAIGYIVISWAWGEQALDGCVGIIYHQHNGKSFRKEIPRSLEQKEEFLADALKKLPSLAPFKDDIQWVLSEIKATKRTRHDLVHGAVQSLELGADGKYHLINLRAEKHQHRSEAVVFDPKTFPTTANRITELGVKTSRLGRRLLGGE